MSLIDLYVLLLPVVGTFLVIAVGKYDSRRLRAETARAREAEHNAQQ